MTTTTLDLIAYYAELLILQYVGKPRAYATIEAVVTPVVMPQVSVQTIAFDAAPTSGQFVLSYDGTPVTLDWNESVGDIQTELRTIPGLSGVTVAGSVAGLLLTVTFTGVTPQPAFLFVVDSSTLLATATPVALTITETDETLPLAVQNGFNLIVDTTTAVGVQLDVLGKYAGVVRSGLGFTSNIVLDDADFLSLIRMAIVQNSAGSSLSDIQGLLHEFFPGQILVFDYLNMQLNYLVSTAIGSQDLLQLFITEGILPRPMAVRVALIIYAPVITTFFGFRTYALPAFNATPFNSYADYQLDWPWLSYANAIII